MPDFRRRSVEREWMDGEDIGYDEFAHCLRHLRVINILTLAYCPTLRWLKTWRGQGALSVLDVGCGGGDMLRAMQRQARRDGQALRLTGLDINPHAGRYALSRQDAGIAYRTTNIFDLPDDYRADLIASALFTHHLDDSQLVAFLRWMDRHAAKGWFINDLHRHSIAYYFILWATRLLPVNRLVRHDAAVSVARAFRRRDWLDLLDRAGIERSRTRIAWHFPFRLCVSCTTR